MLGELKNFNNNRLERLTDELNSFGVGNGNFYIKKWTPKSPKITDSRENRERKRERKLEKKKKISKSVLFLYCKL